MAGATADKRRDSVSGLGCGAAVVLVQLLRRKIARELPFGKSAHRLNNIKRSAVAECAKNRGSQMQAAHEPNATNDCIFTAYSSSFEHVHGN